MGTSADYSAPPNWSNLKGDVTRSGSRSLTPQTSRDLVRDFVSTNGGSRSMSTGGGQLGSGRTARSTARSLGGFISSVARDGLDTALRNSGLEDLVGKSVTETLLGILTLCGGTDGDIDSVDARHGLSRTLDDLCENAETTDELEAILKEQIDGDGLGKLMIAYFGNYLFEQFCRVFFGQLVKKHGDDKAESFLDSIRDVIKSALEHKTLGLDLSKVQWFGAEGEKMAAAIMQNTLAVFE